MKSIVFCGGGTAGHVMPNLALAEKLKNIARLYYIGTDGMEKELLSKYSDYIAYISIGAPKLRRSLSPELLKLPSRLAASIKSCTVLLKELSPSLVISKGGYASFPVVYAAKKLSVPVFAHESDSSLGLANRFSLPYIQRLYSPFSSSVKQAGKKGVLCATPLTQAMQSGSKSEGLALSGFSGKRPILLCLGGSLGAQALNRTICEALPSLIRDFDIFAVTGKGKRIDFVSPHFKQLEFTSKLPHLYAIADIAFTRAGSNTLGELSYYKIPMLLTPLCKSSRGEQIKNAEYYKRLGVAEILPEKDLSASRLLKELHALYKRLPSIKKNYPVFQKDDKMLKDICKLIQAAR